MSFQNNYQDDVEESDDDLYSFNQRENDNFAGFAVNNLQAASFRPAPQSFHAPLQQQPPPRTGFGGNPWQNNMGEDVQRPMTSVNAVGYSSDHDKRSMLSENLAMKKQAPPLHKKSENSPEDMAQEMEREVNALIEESAALILSNDPTMALEKAKIAQKKEKSAIKFREEKNCGEHNIELSFAVLFNLARVYHANGMYTEALDTYTSIVKNNHFANGVRLRVNMGNIYFEQRQYHLAIKMYRMALDFIMPATHNDLRTKILKNIGTALIKIGQYPEAIEKFEQVVENTNTCPQTAFNLLLCYFALGQKKNMCKAFRKLLNVQIPGIEFDQDLDDETYAVMNDELRYYLKQKQKTHWDYILRSAMLIAEVIEENWESGYDYVIEQLKSFALKKEKCNLVGEMEMAKALNYLKHKKFSKAIEALKSFEKKDKYLQARASTNLAYLYLLESDLPNAFKYASLSVEYDKYNSKALVNLGNCHYLKKDFATAKNIFQEALNAEPDCAEAIYNLGLVCKELKHFEEALIYFKKLHTIIPESIEVIYQIANTYHKVEDNTNAVDWYNRLITRVPTDPTVLHMLGTLYAKEADESQAYNSYLESYRYYPVIMEAVSWLGLYFVKNEIYEKALQYFERATQIQPKEIEWQLMVASCHRRIGAYQQAKKCYEDIHQKHPDNAECLKYLVQICSELALKKEKKQYSKKLMKLEEKMKKQSAPSTTPEVPEEVEKEDSVYKFKTENNIVQKPLLANPAPAAPEDTKKVNDKRVEKDDEDILNSVDDNYMDHMYAN